MYTISKCITIYSLTYILTDSHDVIFIHFNPYIILILVTSHCIFLCIHPCEIGIQHYFIPYHSCNEGLILLYPNRFPLKFRYDL